MAKQDGTKRSKAAASRWVCNACGAESSGWFGKCSSCGEWNTIEEIPADPAGGRVMLSRTAKASVVPASAAVELADASERIATRLGELDRVLGGGLVKGSLVLLGGAPGIGKSTLLLQACAGVAGGAGMSVLYVSGEESVAQVGSRAARLGAATDRLSLLAETRIEGILEAADELAPAVLVVDSIQTVYSGAQEGLPGNLNQIRSVAGTLLSWAKTRDVPVVIVGHVTKDGQLAGPRMLEHMVDAVLSFEGDEERATRLLRATKNRFGSTQELGVFEMAGDGLLEVSNPSQAFLSEQPSEAPGSCVTASLEGSRPLLVEVQALLGPSPGGSPRRTCVGADPARVAMLLAVLQRHGGLDVIDQDVFVNVTGGLRLREPGVDLAVLLAIASSHMNRAVPVGTLALGEVGLNGELRRVPRLDGRIAEAERLGFRRAVVPRPREGAPPSAGALELWFARNVSEAIELALGS